MFSELVIGYLFLGGAGAGGCIACAVMSLLIPTQNLRPALEVRFRSAEGRLFRQFLSPLLVVSAGALLLGIVCLLADLGQPTRVLLIAFSGKVTYLTVGAWSLVLCIATAAALLLVWRGTVKVTLAAFRTVNVLLIGLALVVALYTGLLLSGMAAVPLWSGWWTVALFLVSALSCGMALATGLASVTESARWFGVTLARLELVDLILILLEITLVAFWLAFAVPEAGTATALVAAQSVETLVTGPLASLFWIGFLAIGLVLPFAIEAGSAIAGATVRRQSSGGALSLRQESARRASLAAVSITVLIGGFLLRYLMVAAALQPITVFAPGL